MNYPQIAQRVYGEPWCITPEMHQSIQHVLEERLKGEKGHDLLMEHGTQNQFNAAVLNLTAPQNQSSRVYHAGNNGQLAYVPVHGIMGKGLSVMEQMCGGYPIGQLENDIDEIKNDPKVSSVLFDFDSPGGQVLGIPETARMLAALSNRKDTYGFTGGQSDSASYWLMSQCNHIYLTESAEVGSIGVYMALYDTTEALKAQGKKLILVKAGKHKGAGMPGNPLSAEEIQTIQDKADAIYESFTGMVKSKRPKVTSDVMQGQTYIGQAAVDCGLADALVSSLATLVRQLG